MITKSLMLPGSVFTLVRDYFITAIAAMTIHMIIVLPLIYLVILRKNPFRFMAKMVYAFITALGTGCRSVNKVTTSNIKQYFRL